MTAARRNAIADHSGFTERQAREREHVEIAALAKQLNAAGSVRRSQKKTGTLPAGSAPVNESSLVGSNCYAASTLEENGPVVLIQGYDPSAAP